MCVEGIEVESNAIWAYCTARNALIKIVSRFVTIYQLLNMREHTETKGPRWPFLYYPQKPSLASLRRALARAQRAHALSSHKPSELTWRACESSASSHRELVLYHVAPGPAPRIITVHKVSNRYHYILHPINILKSASFILLIKVSLNLIN